MRLDGILTIADGELLRPNSRIGRTADLPVGLGAG
jgi:hypothetical protein